MKICSFNVNSIRSRKDLLVEWLLHKRADIDVLCLQEIKCTDEKFPVQDFEALGYKCEVSGQKTYNGLAICSKNVMAEVRKGFGDPALDDQKRVLSARIEDISIINVYAPHGDARGADKFEYKLNWYDKLLSYLKENHTPEDHIIVTGDLNVAKDDLDVFDPTLLKDTIGTMPEEREKFKELLRWGLTDSFRELYPKKQEFTWWDYVTGGIWRNQGMRIDYFLCTKTVMKRTVSVDVDLWPRRRRTPTPSDHAPIIATINQG